MHHKAKVRRGIGLGRKAGFSGKTPVMALLERGKGKKASRVKAEVIAHVGEDELIGCDDHGLCPVQA